MLATSASRAFIESEVSERSEFRRAEDVRKLASIANAERQFGREYHGRFIIELLQNAADAWRRVALAGRRSKVRVVLAEGPTVLVANQGEVLSAETIIRSLGHIGASTKPPGEAIGHKGIGFKSVLEMALTPEVYSGFDEGRFEVAVRFDPDRALAEVRARCPKWEEYLTEVTGLSDDPLDPIPALQFPFWVDAVPKAVVDLGSQGFTTIIRLSFDPAHADRLRLNKETWEATAREACRDVTDEILLLLEVFDEVVIDDTLEGEVVEITQSAPATRQLGSGVRVDQAEIRRDRLVSSRWLVYRDELPGATHLESELVVGLPLNRDPALPSAIESAHASRPFHLFFPTRIASGTPFLLHGYFEVAAGRANFYHGSDERNRLILERLSGLVAEAVADAVREGTDTAGMAHLLGQASPAEDPLAECFRVQTLAALDEVAWVPTKPHDDVPPVVPPAHALAFRPGSLSRRLAEVFDPGYTWKRTGSAAIDGSVDEPGLEYLAARRAALDSEGSLWSTIRRLLLPGDLRPWRVGEEDQGFSRLLDLVHLLDAEQRSTARQLFDDLRGEAAARLIPAVAADGGRDLVPLPATRGSAGAGRSHIVMARRREQDGADLVPPPVVQVSFIADGLLDTAVIGAAQLLGVQEYVVDNLLDRLEGLDPDDQAGPSVLDFVWRLLVREQRSEFGLRRARDDLFKFDPGHLFWFQPGRATTSESDRDRERRERGLASLLLPSRSGAWVRSSDLAFGEDWANWLMSDEAGRPSPAGRQRADAYRDLESLRPGGQRLLAPPETVVPLLADIPIWEEGWPEDLADEHRGNLARHLFLVRLGVWEVPPVDVFVDRTDRSGKRIPWPGPLADRLAAWVRGRRGWAFGYADYAHENVHIGEDFCFSWSFEGAEPERLARSIARGAALYERLQWLWAFCPACRTHRTRYTTVPGDFPSRLALQLQQDPWLPCVRDGLDIAEPLPAPAAWWEPAPPESQNIKQSPLRYLPLVRANTPLPESLRKIAAIPQLATAPLARITRLLGDLQDAFLADRVDPDPRKGTAKQAFVGIHRLAYNRLAEISSTRPEDVRKAVEATKILCDVGKALDYVAAADARHDDGRFSAYRRYFGGRVPFSVLARDRDGVARRLGIKPFEIVFTRAATEEGLDVTELVAELLGERIAEFLAIVVNHSVGTQTLEIGSEQFRERARRLRRLRIVQLNQLLLEARVEDTDITASLSGQRDFEVFLDGPTSPNPILYHTFRGEALKDGLRRRLGTSVAAVLENANYADLFTLLLQQEGDAAREEFLLEKGITAEDVDAIREAIGIQSEADRVRTRVWFAAIFDVLSGESEAAADLLAEAMVAGGLSQEVAARLVECGGGPEVRSDTSETGALALLVRSGISLERLHGALVARGDPGLVIRVASERLHAWRARHGRRVAAVFATKVPEAEAKALLARWTAPAALRFALDPEQEAVITPVVEDLLRLGWKPDVDAMSKDDPADELVRLAGCADVFDLDRRVRMLYNAEERAAILRRLALEWRRELRLIGVSVRSSGNDPRARIRSLGEEVDALIPPNPPLPSVVAVAMDAVLSDAHRLRGALAALMVDDVSAPTPDRTQITALLLANGVDPTRLAEIERILAIPARAEVRRLRGHIEQIRTASLRVTPPPTRNVRPKPYPKLSTIRGLHVGSGGEQRRRELGDEGERWALAAIVEPLLDYQTRQRAIPEIVELLRAFDGDPVDKALAHAETVLDPEIDEEDLLEELTALLHVSPYSDDFGFDLLGWLRPQAASEPVAMCIEAKNSVEARFHFSVGEWDRALQLRNQGLGDRYAVLVVRRKRGLAMPERLDLLVDPVGQCDDGVMCRDPDGFLISY